MFMLIFTIAAAVAFAFVLYQIYLQSLLFVLKRYNWNLEELRDYPKTPMLQVMDVLLHVVIIMAIFYNFFN